MANVLNRTTKQYILSVNTPDYPVVDWIINPDLSAVSGVPSKYWNIVGDTVTEMSQAEKDAVDAAEAAAALITRFEVDQENEFQTTSSKPVTVLALSPSNKFTSGTYRVDWQCTVKRQTNRGLVNLRILVDSSIVFEATEIDPRKWVNQTGFVTAQWDEDTHRADLQIYSSISGRAVFMKNAKLRARLEPSG